MRSAHLLAKLAADGAEPQLSSSAHQCSQGALSATQRHAPNWELPRHLTLYDRMLAGVRSSLRVCSQQIPRQSSVRSRHPAPPSQPNEARYEQAQTLGSVSQWSDCSRLPKLGVGPEAGKFLRQCCTLKKLTVCCAVQFAHNSQLASASGNAGQADKLPRHAGCVHR